MVDYDKPTLLQRNEPCPKLHGNQGWTPYWRAFVMRDNYTRLRCNEDENIDQV